MRTKDAWIRQGVAKSLQGKEKRPINTTNEAGDELDQKEASTIRQGLSDEVVHNIFDQKTGYDFWKTLEQRYMAKNITNKLFLKE